MLGVTMMLLASLALVLGVITVDCYNIGLGRADVTGPAAEIGMMGYAKQGQNTGGGRLGAAVCNAMATICDSSFVCN